ncbi:MAG TPA: DUF167 domain-containing protein [Pyrinomonadaceae bacterium]|nr:DUF167 domain-containing protein [Pyrinomonadaceae bacterium]
MAEETIHCTAQDGAIIFSVRVVPRASRSRVVGAHDGALRVRVAAPPVEGAANEELTRTLAEALGVPRRAVEIKSGHASKLKQVRVHGSDCSKLQSLA